MLKLIITHEGADFSGLPFVQTIAVASLSQAELAVQLHNSAKKALLHSRSDTPTSFMAVNHVFFLHNLFSRMSTERRAAYAALPEPQRAAMAPVYENTDGHLFTYKAPLIQTLEEWFDYQVAARQKTS